MWFILRNPVTVSGKQIQYAWGKSGEIYIYITSAICHIKFINYKYIMIADTTGLNKGAKEGRAQERDSEHRLLKRVDIFFINP